MSEIEVRVNGGVGVITLNRPAKRNAMTIGMWQGLASACAELRDDPRVRAVLLAGAGPSFAWHPSSNVRECGD